MMATSDGLAVCWRVLGRIAGKTGMEGAEWQQGLLYAGDAR